MTSHILRSLLVFIPLDFNLSFSIVTHMYYLHESFIAIFQYLTLLDLPRNYYGINVIILFVVQ